MKLLFLFILLSSNLHAVAPNDDCSTIDHLRKDPVLGAHWRTPRNQDGMGWCYAFPAADLLTEVTGEPASAAYVSYDYNRYSTWNLSWLWQYTGVPESALQVDEGGTVRESVRRAKKSGICLESALPSESSHMTYAHSALSQAMVDLVELRKMIQDKRLKRKQFIDCVECKQKIESNKSIQNFFPNLNSGELYDVIVANQTSSVSVMIQTLADRYCSPSRKSFPSHRNPVTLKHNHFRKETNFAKIDRALSQKKPIAFSTPLGLIDDTRPGQHAMTIIAREKRGGECKYLVRNSWGRGCSYYPVKVVRDDCIPQEGAMWISKERLNLFVSEFTYVD
jgi:hypothetical protein